MERVSPGCAFLSAVASGLLLLGADGSARAQAPSPTGPRLPVPLVTAGDPPASAGSFLSPALAVLPLRLSLQPMLLPVEPAMSSQPCEAREEPSGNTFHGFPLQGYASLRLAPRLTLHGFSSLGCPTNGGIGGALTYTAPLQPDLWLVLGAGAYTIPPHAQAPASGQFDLRADLAKRAADGRVWTVGIGRKGVTFGGQW